MKIVINECYGGFSLSAKGIKRYFKLKGQSVCFYKQTKFKSRDGVEVFSRIEADDAKGWFYSSLTDEGETLSSAPKNVFYSGTIDRRDPTLIQVVEEMGLECWGDCARLSVVDIEPGTYYKIDVYDGYESIKVFYFDKNEWELAE